MSHGLPEEVQEKLFQLAEGLGIDRATAAKIQESAWGMAVDDVISERRKNVHLEAALQLRFNEEQAESHIKELLLIRPGNEIQVYRKDLSLKRGWFVRIQGEPGEYELVCFMHYFDNHIGLGFAPFGSVQTPTTVAMVSELKAWKERKPSFVREDDNV